MTSKNNRKKFYTFFILFATLLIGIGYATVNSILLDITGSAKANVQDGIFITEVEYNSNSGADTLNSEIIYAYQTNLNSHIILSNTSNNSYIKYSITIYNGNSYDCVFDGVKYMLSDETYSNVGITFDVDENDVDTILESGDSITFTITFHYDNYQFPQDGNNTLTSLLNFQYSKIYYVTYENFVSTSGYPTFVREGDTLTVSFGTLDAPIEVKRAGVIVSSSEYSYSAYILNYSNITAAIHIRKLTKYTITNLITNGSFENNLDNWSINPGGSFNYWKSSTSIKKFGTKSYYRTKSSHIHNYITQNISWINGHKYYYLVYGYSNTQQTLTLDVTNKGTNGGTIKVTINNSVWTKASTIYNPNFTGNNTISVNFAETTDNVYVDGITIVDLTAAFGSGNEPDKTWCDANIDYFDKTKNVYI